jgi:hypothetical protein
MSDMIVTVVGSKWLAANLDSPVCYHGHTRFSILYSFGQTPRMPSSELKRDNARRRWLKAYS